MKGDPAAARPIGTTRAEIRRTAARCALAVGCICIPLAVYHGRTLPQAVSDGAVAALLGLATWSAYHILSRRNDGLMFGGMATFPLLSEKYPGFWGPLLFGLLVYVPIGCLFGLWNRNLGAKVPDPRVDGPL